MKSVWKEIVLRERKQSSVRENVCINSKNVKSHVFLDFEKKVKNVKKRTYSFRGH